MKLIRTNGIGYFPIPKSACTSIKNTLFKIEHSRDYNNEVDTGRHIHQYWEKNKQEYNKEDFNFIILRDPIKRLISAYTNRVCHHRELSLEKIKLSNPRIASSFEIYSPGLGQFLDSFYDYYKVNSINHHCMPVTQILKSDLTPFDKIYPIEKMNLLVHDLSEKLEREIIIPREQTGGRKIPLQDLSKNHMDFLIDFYESDYYLMKDFYSFDQVWKEWKKGV